MTGTLLTGCVITNTTKEKDFEAYYQEVQDSDIVYGGGTCYVDSQILLSANEGVSERQIERLADSQGGTIVGYISISDDYQIDFQNGKTYEELNDIINDWNNSDYVAEATLNYAIRMESSSSDSESEQTESNPIDYKGDPWIDAANSGDTSGSEWSEVSPDGNNWWAEAVMMPSVWEMDEEFEPVRVGIYDTMFDTDNEDLMKAFVKLWNNPEDENGECLVSSMYDRALQADQPTTNFSHGTHVAGLIAAEAENDFGIAGVSQNAELYGFAYKSEAEDTGELSQWGDLFEIKYSFALMLNEGVKVINYSVNYSELSVAAQHDVQNATNDLQKLSKAYESFFKDCLDAGYDFLIIKSAGNLNGNNWTSCDVSEDHPYGYMVDDTAQDNTLYDAQYDIFGAIEDETVKEHILIVGAAENHTDYYTTSDFSVVGERVDVYAPGTNILSDLPTNITGMSKGTSMATPIVTGITSLVWGVNPELSAEQVAEIIRTSAIVTLFDSESVSNIFHKVETTPIVNAYFAVQLASETTGTGETGENMNSGIVTGMTYIIDENNNPVPLEEAVVKVFDSEGNTVDNAVMSDQSGYHFVLPAGTYTIRAELEGYESKSKEVTLESNSVLNVDFEMKRSAIELTDYYDDLHRLVSILSLAKDEYGNYESDSTWMSLYNWDKDFIVRNENPLITAYGISIGDSLKEVQNSISVYGINISMNTDSGAIIYLWDDIGDYNVVKISLVVDEGTNKVTSWNVTNWPEGEDASYYINILSEAQSKNVTKFEEWQSEYISYILNDYYDHYECSINYHLVFIDNDIIPELYITYDTVADGSKVVSFTESGIIEQEVYLSGMSYLEKTGMLRDSGGKMGSFHDIIYELKNGRFQEVAAGEYIDTDGKIGDDGGFVFNYYWNGTQVSESEYQNHLNNVFPTGEEISPWENSDGSGLFDMGAEIACFSA